MGEVSRSHCVFVSLPLGFYIAPTVFLFFSHSVFTFLVVNIKMKH